MNSFSLRFGNRTKTFDRPIVMGIINCTPDSFYEASRSQSRIDVLDLAKKHITDGATILDLGAFSTRPGGELISEQEEIDRLERPLQWILDTFPDAILSIDTFRAEVARYGLDNGASIINDISGGSFDPNILQTVAEYDAPYIAMYMQGDMASMHNIYQHEAVEEDALNYFKEKMDECRSKGVNQVIIDPGFGFSKSMDDNFRLLDRLETLHELNLPILVGLSRKRMVWQTLGSSPAQALNGTTVLHTIALTKGASVIRTHDVKEAVEAIELVSTSVRFSAG